MGNFNFNFKLQMGSLRNKKDLLQMDMQQEEEREGKWGKEVEYSLNHHERGSLHLKHVIEFYLPENSGITP